MVMHAQVTVSYSKTLTFAVRLTCVYVTIIGGFKGGIGSPLKNKLIVKNLEEMLKYALVLLNQVFLAH